MTAYEQRSYAGAAADTLLNADITNSATSFSVTPGSGAGYPDGSGGPFFVIIDWDTSKAEKIRCSGRVNDTFTVAGSGGGRGQDGTSAQAHTANAKVRHVITATDIQEANRAAANTIGKVTTKGDLLVATGATALTRLPAGVDGAPLVPDSTQASGLRYDNAAWTSTAPSLNSGTAWSITGSSFMRYKLVGKTCYVQLYAQLTAGNTPGATLWSLPYQPQNILLDVALGSFVLRIGSTGQAHVGIVVPYGTGLIAKFYRHGQTIYLGQNPDNYVPASGDTFTADLTYETA